MPEPIRRSKAYAGDAEADDERGRALSLPRPAALGKHRPARVGRAPQKARKLERLVALGARGQPPRTLKRIVSKDLLIDPVRRPLRLFHHSLR